MHVKEYFSMIKEKAASSFNQDGKNFQLILYIVIIILINIASISFNFRIDLTRNNTYSLTEKSKDIVSNLKENLKIRVLFSNDLPAQHTSVFRYLKDILEEYNYYGNEYFSYEIVDEKDLEKQANDFGIRAVQSQEFANDQVKVRRTYMGLVVQQSDLIEKIESITDPVGLEYLITSLIEKMSSKIDGLLKLKEPIEVALYLDGNLKLLPIDGIDKLEEKVKEAVDKCNKNNYDKIKFQLLDPSADKKGVRAAELFGLNKLKWRAGRTRSGKRLEAGEGVLGIVLKNVGRYEVIELNVAPTLFGGYVVVGLENIEDKINNAIENIVSSNPRIGYITGHGEVDISDQKTRMGGGLFKQILSDVYDVKKIDLTKSKIPSDLKLIIINGPRKEYAESELYKIDQFLMKGKSAIFFIDSYNEINMGAQQNMFRQQPIVLPVKTGLDELLKHYGVSVNRDIVLDNNCAKVNLGSMIKDYPLVPVIKESGFDQDNVITKYLKGIAFLKVSSINVDDKKINKHGIIKRDIVSSSDESWLMTGRINFNPLLMSSNNVDKMSSYSLVVLISGKFESFFKGRAIPPDIEKSKTGSITTLKKIDKTVRTGKTEIIVLGTSEITRSGFIMDSRRIISNAASTRGDEVSPNGIFLHNMVDYLAGNLYIPEMRSKSLEFNPLEKTGDRTRVVFKSFNIAGLPVLVILLGLIIWRRRISRKKRLMEEFAPGGELRNE